MRSFTFLNIPLSGCPGLLDHYTLTFFAAAKKDKKRKRLEAPAKWAPWSATGSGATGIRALACSCACDKGFISSHSALRASRTGLHGKPPASLLRSGNHRLRLGGAARAEAVPQYRFFCCGAALLY